MQSGHRRRRSGAGRGAVRLLFVWCAPVWLSACMTGGEGGAARAAAGEERVVDDDAIHIIGTSEWLARVMDMVRLEDGTFWVLNQSEPYFLAFDAQGNVSRSWGKRGGGPDEFRQPASLVVDEARDVWVYDGAAHALIRVSAEEADPLRIALPRDTLPPNRLIGLDNMGLPEGRTWVERVPGGIAVARAVSSGGVTDPFYGAELFRVQPDGAVNRLLSLGDHMEPVAREFAAASLFVPNPLWSMCSESTLALYDPQRNAVRRLTLAGEEQGEAIQLPPEQKVPVTPDDVFRLVFRLMTWALPASERPDSASMYEEFRSEYDSVRGQVSPVFPEYTTIACPDATTAWLQTFDRLGLMGRGLVWLRVTAEATERVRFPATFSPLRFTTDGVYGVVLDEFEIPSLAWIDIRDN